MYLALAGACTKDYRRKGKKLATKHTVTKEDKSASIETLERAEL